MTSFDTRTSELPAAMAAAAGSISVGFVPFFITGLHAAGVDTTSALFFRYFIALGILVPLAAWALGGLAAQWREGGKWLFLNGLVLGAFQAWCYFRAVELLPTSIVITVFYCYPVITITLDRLLFHMPIYRTTVLAVIIVIAGVALTSLPGLDKGRLDPQGLFFAALAAVSYAVYIAMAYPITRRVAPLASASFIYTSMAVAFGTVCLARGHLAMPSEPTLWINLLFMGTFGGALQILAFSFALPRLSSSGYALIVCLEFVTVVLAGVLLLSEKLGPLQWFGIVMVLSGILLERLARASRAAQAASVQPPPAVTKAAEA